MSTGVSLPPCPYRTGVHFEVPGKPTCSCNHPETKALGDKFEANLCWNCNVKPDPVDAFPPEFRAAPVLGIPATIDQTAWVSDKAEEPTLSIGMAVVNDFQGAMFTAMNLQLQAKQELRHPVEIIIVENQNTATPCKMTQDFCKKAGFVYKHLRDSYGTAAPRNEVFKLAKNKMVWCVDSHILHAPGSIRAMVNYFQNNPGSKNLISGPLADERGNVIATHWSPKWREGMYGTWEMNRVGMKRNRPFEIALMGLGSFAMLKDAWPGFHPKMRNFGGEEGYIHEKVRQLGGKCLCIPQAPWWHRFSKPAGGQYVNTWGARVFNYIVGWMDLGKDPFEVIEHFKSFKKDAAILEALELCKQEGIEVVAPPSAPKRKVALVVAVDDATLEDNNIKTTKSPTMIIPRVVTCLCPTFNRLGDKNQQALLEEAIEAFFRQTYPHKKMLILNDQPQQDASFQHELVKVVNTGRRFYSLGDKHNALFAMADSEYLCMWDDDDISLPHRLETMIDRLGDSDYYNPRRQWFMPGGVDGQLVHDHSHGVCFNSSIVKRSALRTIGMAPPTAASDLEMDRALTGHSRVIKAITETPPPPSEWSYIYRWGVSNNHVSGRGQIDENYTNNGMTFVPPGVFKLQPHWRKDYAAMAQTHIRANNLS